jgi:DNA adenine methylase
MVTPIIKWAGGKSKVIPFVKPLILKANCKRMFDLFCGSLAIPLAINSVPDIILNDINTPLITLYLTIQAYPRELIRELEILNKPDKNTRENYETIRSEFNILKKQLDFNVNDSIHLSALFIYLNKRSFNGLYRENKNGEMNVPYRKYTQSIFNSDEILALSEFLNKKSITLSNKNFEEFNLTDFIEGDLVYLDPPYYPVKKTQFTSYWKTPFLVDEQTCLALFCRELDKKGVKFILSNSPCDEIKTLYEGFNQQTFQIGRQMRSAKKLPGPTDESSDNEILIWNF